MGSVGKWHFAGFFAHPKVWEVWQVWEVCEMQHLPGTHRIGAGIMRLSLDSPGNQLGVLWLRGGLARLIGITKFFVDESGGSKLRW